MHAAWRLRVECTGGRSGWVGSGRVERRACICFFFPPSTSSSIHLISHQLTPGGLAPVAEFDTRDGVYDVAWSEVSTRKEREWKGMNGTRNRDLTSLPSIPSTSHPHLIPFLSFSTHTGKRGRPRLRVRGRYRQALARRRAPGLQPALLLRRPRPRGRRPVLELRAPQPPPLGQLG